VSEVIVHGYELRIVVCSYKNSPITAEQYRTPPEAFTALVDPVSGPPSFAPGL
jgi:hypothetical protein